jgi:hypothetical protein
MEKLKQYIAYIAILIPIFIYFKFVNAYAINMPYRDDYHAILQYLIEYKSLPTFSEKFWKLFALHNEHRIFHSRVLYVAYNSFIGEINFRTIVIIGNLQLLGCFLFLVALIKKIDPQYWYISSFILSLCIFDISSYENIMFAMGSMQNFGVFLFFTAAIFFYQKQSKLSLFTAVVFQFLCAYASGNGIVAGFLLVLLNILNFNKLKLTVSSIAAIAFTIPYFINYNAPKLEAVADAPENTISNMLTYFLHMVGGHYSYDSGVLAGFLVSLVFVITAFMLVKNKAKKVQTYAPLIVVILFVLGSMATTSIFRLKLGMLFSYSSRYLIYSHLLNALLFAILASLISKTFVKWSFVIFSTLILINAYKSNYAYGEPGFERQKYRMEIKDLQDSPIKEDYKNILKKACDQKIYCSELNNV